jgi:hypothetical protein
MYLPIDRGSVKTLLPTHRQMLIMNNGVVTLDPSIRCCAQSLMRVEYMGGRWLISSRIRSSHILLPIGRSVPVCLSHGGFNSIYYIFEQFTNA